eukprot:NODE_79_length_23048_cov_0.747614.p9 type:complete len:254 gc:universal NODE_79_length_23048_cov_0.747614:3014-3775(+)
MDILKLKLERLGCNTILEQNKLSKLEKNLFDQSGKPQAMQYFIVLVKWLFQLNQIQPKWNSETEQNKILDEISSIFKSMKISVPSASLKLGSGPEIATALNELCNKVLPVNGKVVYKNESVLGNATQRQLEYEFIDEQITQKNHAESKTDIFTPLNLEFQNYVVPEISVWNREVESLDFSELVPHNNTDWRVHWEQINGHIQYISQNLNGLEGPLLQMVKSNSDILEKILAREKHLNEAFSSLVFPTHLDFGI